MIHCTHDGWQHVSNNLKRFALPGRPEKGTGAKAEIFVVDVPFYDFHFTIHSEKAKARDSCEFKDIMVKATSDAKNKPVYTKEKARHLVRVYLALLCAMLLVGWLNLFILKPLKDDEKEMAHMDPSEIKAIPYSIRRLTSFTMLPVVAIMLLWLKNSPDRMTSNLLSLLKLTLVVYALFGLAGTNIVDNYKHSLTAALYVAALASTTFIGNGSFNVVQELPFSDPSNLIAFCRLYGMILTSVPFCVMNILDAGMQIQRWPLPILVGTTYGYVIGTFIGVTSLYYQRKSKGQ
eukprot:scaffold858_cov123-Cylindrotheca_fusiformis.AAC.18